MNELHARGIDPFEKTEAEIKKGTLSILRCTDAQISYMSYYEIPSCKPIHDSTNLIQKLPVNIENKQTQVEFEKCSSVTVEGMNIHVFVPHNHIILMTRIFTVSLFLIDLFSL